MKDHPSDPMKQQLMLMRLQTILILLILILIALSAAFLFGKVSEVMAVVNGIDVQEINSAVTSLKTAADTLSEVDTGSLNSGIRDLSLAAEGLSQLDFQKLQSFMDSLETFSRQMDEISSFFSKFLK